MINRTFRELKVVALTLSSVLMKTELLKEKSVGYKFDLNSSLMTALIHKKIPILKGGMGQSGI